MIHKYIALKYGEDKWLPYLESLEELPDTTILLKVDALLWLDVVAESIRIMEELLRLVTEISFVDSTDKYTPYYTGLENTGVVHKGFRTRKDYIMARFEATYRRVNK